MSCTLCRHIFSLSFLLILATWQATPVGATFGVTNFFIVPIGTLKKRLAC
jgi:hypothetical protein